MNIPTSLIVVLLVVAWLVVLVPMVARRRERVPQAEPAGADFRVLAPSVGVIAPAAGPRRERTNDDRDGRPGCGNLANSDEALVSVGAGPQQAGRRRGGVGGRPGRGPTTVRPAPVRRAAAAPGDPGCGGPGRDADGRVGRGRAAGTGRGRSGRRSSWPPTPTPGMPSTDVEPTIPDEIDEQEWADHVAAAPAPAPFGEVDAEQLRPVPRRPGRGGFDPEAAEATRAYRYQQRRRVALILLIADRCVHRVRCPVHQLAVVRCGGQRRPAGRLPGLPAPSGADRSSHPAAADGASAAGPADPARVRPTAAAQPRRDVRGGSGTTWSTWTTTIRGSTISRSTSQPMTYRRAAGQ